jgi:hypothetical protein
MKTYETPNTLSQAVANLEDELAYYKEQVKEQAKVLELFNNFNVITVARAAEHMVDSHLRSQAPHHVDMKEVYKDAGFDIESKAFHNAVLWITMRWSKRDREGKEDMLEYFVTEMPNTYLSYLHDTESMDHTARFAMERELGKALRTALLTAKEYSNHLEGY